jgi:RNA polymerase sigma factor (sigma-70 family)
MIELTEQQIADAKGNDLEAVAAVVAATDERVVQLARRFARTSSGLDHELAEDLAQVGRIAVWQAIGRFEGTDVAQFFAFIDRTLKTTLSDERRALSRPGVSQQALKDFEQALAQADGDPHEAVKLACSAEAMGKRKMSREHAHAARNAWEGALWADAPAGSEAKDPNNTGITTITEQIASTIGIPEDLLTSTDITSAKQAERRNLVHVTLAQLSERMSHVLRASFGIDPAAYYGPGEHDEELAADMGLTSYQVQQARTKGYKRFAVLYPADALAA